MLHDIPGWWIINHEGASVIQKSSAKGTKYIHTHTSLHTQCLFKKMINDDIRSVRKVRLSFFLLVDLLNRGNENFQCHQCGKITFVLLFNSPLFLCAFLSSFKSSTHQISFSSRAVLVASTSMFYSFIVGFFLFCFCLKFA